LDFAQENSISHVYGREMFVDLYTFVCITDPRFDMVYGRRQPRSKNVNFEFKRREGSSSAHEIIEEVLEPPRRSKRAARRINLPRGAMRIEDSEPESTSSDDDEESPYRQEPSLLSHLQQPLSARGRARTST
jgi:hypothetical protein